MNNKKMQIRDILEQIKPEHNHSYSSNWKECKACIFDEVATDLIQKVEDARLLHKRAKEASPMTLRRFLIDELACCGLTPQQAEDVIDESQINKLIEIMKYGLQENSPFPSEMTMLFMFVAVCQAQQWIDHYKPNPPHPSQKLKNHEKWLAWMGKYKNMVGRQQYAK